MENKDPPIQYPIKLAHQVRLAVSLANSGDSQLRELQQMMDGPIEPWNPTKPVPDRAILGLQLDAGRNLQIRELQGMMDGDYGASNAWFARRLPPLKSNPVEWLGRQAPSMRAPTASAGSNAFMRDEAEALIASGALAPQNHTPERFWGTTQQEHNTEFARYFALEQSDRGPPEQRMSRLYYAEKPPSSKAIRETPDPSMRGFGSLMMMGTGIDLADAAIRKDTHKAVAVSTGVLSGEAYIAIALGTTSAAALPAALAIGGAVGGGFETYAAIRNHDTQRAVKGGIETTLYGIAAWAGAATVADAWFPPLGMATGTVALVAGGLAASMTLSRTICDHWSTVSSWFSRRETASAIPVAPLTVAATTGLAKATAG